MQSQQQQVAQAAASFGVSSSLSPTASARSTSSDTTVTIYSDQAKIPGGGLLADIGLKHQWIKTSDGLEAGMGNRNGVPGDHGQTSPDLPFTPTKVVDHTGRSNDPTATAQRVSGVDPADVKAWLQPGRPTGPWIPGINDCNSFVRGVVSASTPHNIYGMGGASLNDRDALGRPNPLVIRNVVQYPDGSFRTPGPLTK
jgi:hypothetical protein